jgi:chemotaxis protein MotB
MLPVNNPSSAWRVRKQAMAGTRLQTLCERESVAQDSFLWSLADLMTLLLVFFIMLYVNAIAPPPDSPQRVEEPEDRAAAASADRLIGVFADTSMKRPVLDMASGEMQDRQAPAPVERASEPTPAGAPQGEKTAGPRMLADLAGEFSEDFYLRYENRQPVIVLGERITFNAGEAILLSEAQGALRRVARLIRNLGACQVVVTGHTDDRPIQTKAFPSNWELSAARAASVAKALMDSGLFPEQMVIQGQSQFKPLVPNTTADNRRANRRVEISVVSR